MIEPNAPLEVPPEALVARLRQTVADQANRIVDLETLVDFLASNPDQIETVDDLADVPSARHRLERLADYLNADDLVATGIEVND